MEKDAVSEVPLSGCVNCLHRGPGQEFLSAGEPGTAGEESGLQLWSRPAGRAGGVGLRRPSSGSRLSPGAGRVAPRLLRGAGFLESAQQPQGRGRALVGSSELSTPGTGGRRPTRCEETHRSLCSHPEARDRAPRSGGWADGRVPKVFTGTCLLVPNTRGLLPKAPRELGSFLTLGPTRPRQGSRAQAAAPRNSYKALLFSLSFSSILPPLPHRFLCLPPPTPLSLIISLGIFPCTRGSCYLTKPAGGNLSQAESRAGSGRAAQGAGAQPKGGIGSARSRGEHSRLGGVGLVTHKPQVGAAGLGSSVLCPHRRQKSGPSLAPSGQARGPLSRPRPC